MGSLVTIVVIVVGLFFASSIFGIGTEFWSDLGKVAKQKINEQTEQSDPNVENIGNFAKDTGTRVCDLKITFVGSVSGKGHILDSGVDLFHGTYVSDVTLGLLANDHDTSVIKYLWVCSDMGFNQASFFDMLAFNLSEKFGNSAISDAGQLNLFELDDDTDIRWFFTGEKLDNRSKVLVASQIDGGSVNAGAFHKNQLLKAGTKLPAEYNISVWLYDVTEDNYQIEFWNEDFRVNEKPINHHFKFNLCKPAITSC